MNTIHMSLWFGQIKVHSFDEFTYIRQGWIIDTAAIKLFYCYCADEITTKAVYTLPHQNITKQAVFTINGFTCILTHLFHYVSDMQTMMMKFMTEQSNYII